MHEHSRVVAAALDQSAAIPAKIVDREPLTDSDSIRRVLSEASADEDCVGVIAWMHTFSPARMWIGGLSALHKPLLHLHTQFDRGLPWAQIDMDYMNLNQSAHGDREFGYIESRMGVARKTVVGHWADPAVQARIGTLGPGRDRVARGASPADRAVRGQHARRRRHRGRQGRGPDHASAPPSTATASTSSPDAVDNSREAAVDELLERYEDEYELVPALRPGGERRAALAQAAEIEVGLRAVLLDGGFGAFTDTFEDLGTAAPAARHRRPAADGRRLRIRRRGRLEDGDAAAGAEGDGRRASRAGRRSWRTTSTT